MAKAKRTASEKGQSTDGSCCGTDCCTVEAMCCGRTSPGNCKVEAIVAVDARGQMVLPKPLRDALGVGPHDKLAVVSWKMNGRVCCLTLLRSDELADAVRTTYGPLLNDLVRR
jgi:antitoxin PrlF